jgi:hypothetical protein
MGYVMDKLAAVIVLLILVGATGLLTGCATKGEPEVRTVTVNVPVAVSCIPSDLPPPLPAYADEAAAHMTPDERYRAVAMANAQRRARLARVEPILAICR